MLTQYCQLNKERLQKRACENLSDKEKTKSVSMLVNNIEIFLKKSKTNSVKIVVNVIEIFQKTKNKG